MTPFLPGFLLAILGGWLVAACAYAQPGARLGVTLRAALPMAPGVGFGLLSALWFLGLDLAGRGPSFGLLLGTYLVLAGLATLPRREIPPDPGPPPARGPALWARLLFFVVLAVGVLRFFSMVRARPAGGFDAMAIWNYASRFLHRAGPAYRDLIPELDPAHHMDYPLLVSGADAALWGLAGAEGYGAQHLLQLAFFLGMPLLFRQLLRGFVGTIRADLGAAVLALLPGILVWSTRQYADVALGYFVLAGAGGLASRISPSAVERPPLMLTGFMLGAALWTKNEGQPLVLLLLLAFAAVRLLQEPVLRFGKELVRIALGALLPLSALLLFKTGWAPRNDLLVGMEGRLGESIADWGRWQRVFAAFLAEGRPIDLEAEGALRFQSFRRWGLVWPLTLVLFLLGLVRRRFRPEAHELFLWLFSAGALAGWFLVYVLTPKDQDWHIATSLSRLLLQIAPTLLFAALVSASARRGPATEPKS